jgi:tetratricopeptide (TPR) repeat protein
MSGNAVQRNQLAIAHNNYAIALAQQGQWEIATQHLNEAIRLNESDAQFRNNLAGVHVARAQELYTNHQVEQARKALEEALQLSPEFAEAYALLGEIEYNSQRLKEAKAAWQRALELNATMTQVAERLAQVTEELPVESKFDRITQAYFDLRFEDQLERPVGFDVRSALIEARRVVGSDFAYWPNRKLVVLLYSSASFRALRSETPEWLAGQYDGKIRVPLPDQDLDLAVMKQVLFHEYTHALVHDLAKGQCPTWLNEGLAEYEGARHSRPQFQQLLLALDANRLVPWTQLDQQFANHLPVDQVALGYQQSHSIVAYVVQRYGFWRIRRILSGVAAGKPLEQVLSDELHLRFERLESTWRAWLPEFLNASPS